LFIAVGETVPDMQFSNRDDAGRRLAERVRELDLADPLVLALPRGGVPVAASVAAALGAPLDVLVVRKIGAPGRPELGVGAVAEGMVEPVISVVATQVGLSADEVRRLAVAEQHEVARRVSSYRGTRPLPDVHGKDVVLVDDGLATGITAEAGVRALRALGPASLRFAAPVCARQSIDRLAALCDGVVCVASPGDLVSVGQWYLDFTQTSDAEVLAILGPADR
jgi:putative phosphoribosyl transferase